MKQRGVQCKTLGLRRMTASLVVALWPKRGKSNDRQDRMMLSIPDTPDSRPYSTLRLKRDFELYLVGSVS